MRIRFALANYQLNEGEKYPIVLEVSGLNSVDRTTSLNIMLRWYEPHSKTQIPFGMMSPNGKKKFTKKHLKSQVSCDSLDPERIEELSNEIKKFLEEHLRYLESERSAYIEWREAEVSREQFVLWIDKMVKEKWKYKAATRVYHIAMGGYDVEPKSVDKDQEAIIKPSELEYKRLDEVGYDFAPAKNLFDVSQVLSWIAGQQETIEDQLNKTKQIPDLISFF
jgi:hypothetical protein